MTIVALRRSLLLPLTLLAVGACEEELEPARESNRGDAPMANTPAATESAGPAATRDAGESVDATRLGDGASGALASDAAPRDGGSHDGGGSAGGPPLSPPTCIGTTGLPAWRSGMAIGQWKVIASADLSKVTASPAPTGNPINRIEAWNGISADTTNSHLWVGGVGGHADYAGNEVYELDLNASSPQWVLRNQPSPASAYTWNEAYYSDGRPSSSHTYYSLVFVEQRGRMFRFPTGATWGNGQGGTIAIDSFDPAKNDWAPKGTHATMGVSGVEMPTAKDPITGDVYQVHDDAHLYRWNQATDTVDDLGEMGLGSFTKYDTYYAPAVVDPVRAKLYFMADGDTTQNQIRAYDLKLKTWAHVSVSGNGAGVVSEYKNQGMAFYDHCAGAIVFKSKRGGEVVFVDPVTFVATKLTTSGTAPPDPHSLGPGADAGVHTLFQYVPKLGGYAYQPLGSTPLYFLATQ